MQSQKIDTFRFLPKSWIFRAQGLSDKVAEFFIRLKISPNVLSLLGMTVGIGAGLLFFFGQPFWAGIFIIICGSFDTFDGKVALKTDRKSSFGAILDSSLDRYSEFFIYLGLAVYFRHQWIMWLTFLAFLGSMMVSYTRARAEGLGYECPIGMMQRAERIILLTLGVLLGSAFKFLNISMTVVLLLITIFSNITAFQRIWFVNKTEKAENKKKEA